ncbi:MAG: carotenoid biosynthesis protein [Anaerolineae bacterium]
MKTGRLLPGAALLFLGLYAYQAILRHMPGGALALPALPGGDHATTLYFLLFSLLHAAYLIGWRHALAFFALSAAISWGFEQFGVMTGLVYGPYHYTDRFGPRLGHVPLVIPLAWFMMIYPSYVIARLILTGRADTTPGQDVNPIALAAVGALVMTAWDVGIDPLMSRPPMQAWVWERGGLFFGVPLHNFAGWLLTTFTIFLIYGLLERRFRPRPAGPITRGAAAIPVIGYAVMALPLVFAITPLPARLIGLAAMLIPAGLAGCALLRGRMGG